MEIPIYLNNHPFLPPPEQVDPKMNAAVAAAATRLEVLRLRGEGPAKLTPRQVEVVKLVAEGKCTKEIAGELGIAARTVVTHRHNIFTRLGIRDRVVLTHWALAEGLLRNKFQQGDQPGGDRL